MFYDSDFSKYLNMWTHIGSPYPYWRIDDIKCYLQNFTASKNIFRNDVLEFIPYGSQRNGTATNPASPLDFYFVFDKLENIDNKKKIENIKYTEVLYNIFKYDEKTQKITLLKDRVLIENEHFSIIIAPAYLYNSYAENNLYVESLVYQDFDNNITTRYPKLDTKNFDKKVEKCGDNFINMVKIFKSLFLFLSKEIKYISEIPPYFAEALVYFIDDNFFKFTNIDKAVVEAADIIYNTIADKDYLKIFEINDIKVLFSSRSKINHEHVMYAMHECREFLKENV